MNSGNKIKTVLAVAGVPNAADHVYDEELLKAQAMLRPDTFEYDEASKTLYVLMNSNYSVRLDKKINVDLRK